MLGIRARSCIFLHETNTKRTNGHERNSQQNACNPNVIRVNGEEEGNYYAFLELE